MGAEQLTDGTPFASLLLAVFNSILEVFLLCSAGYILARHGILDKKTQKQINRLNVSLFTPALLFSKVAFFLTPAKLKELWVIPIWFVIVTTVSMFVGRILGWMFGLRKSQKSFVMAAAMFMNSNALPIALMQSLVVSVPDLMWGDDDNKNAMLGRALTYLTMYSTLGMVIRYSYGVSLLSRADTLIVPPTPSSDPIDERTPLLSNINPPPTQNNIDTLHTQPSSSTLVHSSSSGGYESDSTNSLHHSPTPKFVGSPPPMHAALPDFPSVVPVVQRPCAKRKNTTFYNSFPNSPNNSRTNLAKYDSTTTTDTEDDPDHDSDVENNRAALPTHSREAPQNHHFMHRVWRRIYRSWAALNNFMTVPLWSALLSLMVASIQPLKHVLLVHMQPLNNAIATAGKCAVPLTLVVLGAYFYVPPAPVEENGASANGNGVANGNKKKRKPTNLPPQTMLERVQDLLRIPRYGSSMQKPVRVEDRPKPGESKTVALAVGARMVITPVLLIPLLVLATRYDWHVVFDDPVFVVVNVILLSSPPALTLAQITQAASGDAFERLISRTIFWAYCIVTPPVMILGVIVALVLAKL